MDLKKSLKDWYAPSAKEVGFVDIAPLSYLMLDGKGDPNSAEAYSQAVETLYSAAYAIRAISKENGQVFTVMPLEGLWWWDAMENHAQNFRLSPQDKSEFLWTMMILQPEHITREIFEAACSKLRQKKDLVALEKLRFETFHEGHAAQIMHIGSYDDEGPNIQKIHAAIEAKGYQLAGKHHEIYLSDPRKTEAAKLKTIIRQPYEKIVHRA